MLKSMQSDLKQRTTELAERLEAAEEITPADRQELEDLALEQTELADLTRNLTKITARPEAAEAPPADDIDAESE